MTGSSRARKEWSHDSVCGLELDEGVVTVPSPATAARTTFTNSCKCTRRPSCAVSPLSASLCLCLRGVRATKGARATRDCLEEWTTTAASAASCSTSACWFARWSSSVGGRTSSSARTLPAAPAVAAASRRPRTATAVGRHRRLVSGRVSGGRPDGPPERQSIYESSWAYHYLGDVSPSPGCPIVSEERRMPSMASNTSQRHGRGEANGSNQ